MGPGVPRDSHIVALLRQAGAIILGKANLSEFANYKGNIVRAPSLSCDVSIPGYADAILHLSDERLECSHVLLPSDPTPGH